MLKPICTLLHHRGHRGDKKWDAVNNTAFFTCTSCGRDVVQQLDTPANSARTLLWIAFTFLAGAGVSLWVFDEPTNAVLGVVGFFATLIVHNLAYDEGSVR